MQGVACFETGDVRMLSSFHRRAIPKPLVASFVFVNKKRESLNSHQVHLETLLEGLQCRGSRYCNAQSAKVKHKPSWVSILIEHCMPPAEWLLKDFHLCTLLSATVITVYRVATYLSLCSPTGVIFVRTDPRGSIPYVGMCLYSPFDQINNVLNLHLSKHLLFNW